MPANDYQFVTRWHLPGTPEEISALLGDVQTMLRIWPALYSRAQEVQPGDERGVGRVVHVATKGHLPYTLRWSFKVTESWHPYGYSLDAWGDMEGTGVWTMEPDAEGTRVTYDWRVKTNKPLLRWLSPILKPLFKRNHDGVMAAGEAGLRRELQRLHAARTTEP